MTTRAFGFTLNDFHLLPCALERLRAGYEPLRIDENGVLGLASYDHDTPLLRKGPRDRGFSLYDEILHAGSVTALGYFRSGMTRVFRPESIPPYRFRGWSFAMGANFVAREGVQSRPLPIPGYIRSNMSSFSAEEIFFHVFLAFMHSAGLMDVERPPVKDVYYALNAAASLMPELTRLEEGDKDLHYLVMLSNGHSLFTLNVDHPLWFIQSNGIEHCASCEKRNRDLGISERAVSHPNLRSVLLLDAQPSTPDLWHRIPFDSVLVVRENLEVEIFEAQKFRP
jgi:hypothetical protein